MEADIFNHNGMPETPEIIVESEYDRKVAYFFTFDEVTLKFTFSLS